MDDKDLGNQKMNNEQKNEGFSGDNLSDNYNPAHKLKRETKKDESGEIAEVKRAQNPAGPQIDTDRNWNENDSMSRGVHSEEAQMRTVENQDLNSDITKHRYDKNNPESKEDRGNIKMDGEEKSDS